MRAAFLLPTKNGARKGLRHGEWLRQSILSAINQLDEPIAIFAVCDACNDDTADILRSYNGANDCFVDVYESDAPLGISAAYNLAAARACVGIGDLSNYWLFPQPDDDISLAHRVQSTLKFVDRQTEKGIELGVCCGWYYIIDPDGIIIDEYAGRETEPRKIRVLVESSHMNSRAADDLGIPAYRADRFFQVGGFPTDYKYAGDWAFILACIRANVLIGCAPTLMYKYRSSGAGNVFNVSTTAKSDHKQEFFRAFDNHRQLQLSAGRMMAPVGGLSGRFIIK